MNQIAVIYWSQTGNTEQMANAICEGIKNAGAEPVLLSVPAVTAQEAAGYDRMALGCPAMGAEVLEEAEFEPFFTELEGKLGGKRVALFGSYGWGDGQWMRDWVARTDDAGAIVVGGEGLMVHETPDDDALAACRALGESLVKA